MSVQAGRALVIASGGWDALPPQAWEAFSGVERALPLTAPFRFVSRDYQAGRTVVDVSGVQIGAGGFTVIAGPCAVESREQLSAAAAAVQAAGAAILRGDAFKPRTSPYSFQGLGRAGLDLLVEARERFGLPFVAEVVDPRDVELVAGCADLIRIGSRNMSNFTLLAEAGRQPRPVMLKRGFTATIEEWLDAAEYIYKEGNPHIVLCERGIRTFEPQTRNTLDISAVPVAPVPVPSAGDGGPVALGGAPRPGGAAHPGGAGRRGRRGHGRRAPGAGDRSGGRRPGAAPRGVRRPHGAGAGPGRRPLNGLVRARRPRRRRTPPRRRVRARRVSRRYSSRSPERGLPS